MQRARQLSGGLKFRILGQFTTAKLPALYTGPSTRSGTVLQSPASEIRLTGFGLVHNSPTYQFNNSQIHQFTHLPCFDSAHHKIHQFSLSLSKNNPRSDIRLSPALLSASANHWPVRRLQSGTDQDSSRPRPMFPST